MTSPRLAQEMARSWAERAQAADEDLRIAAQAPALFKPEWTQRAERRLAVSMAWVRYWRAQVTA